MEAIVATRGLSRGAAELLRVLVAEERGDMNQGTISYSNAERDAEVRAELNELEGLACAALTEVSA